VAQVSVRRCPACDQIVAVSDHGETVPAGEGRAIGTDRDGAPLYRCLCGERIAWPRKALTR